MARVVVRSRSGNVVLAILGAVYALAATVVLAVLVGEVWNAAAVIDRAIQLSLVGSVVCGLWFIAIAFDNLGLRVPWRGLPHIPRRSAGTR